MTFIVKEEERRTASANREVDCWLYVWWNVGKAKMSNDMKGPGTMTPCMMRSPIIGPAFGPRPAKLPRVPCTGVM